MHSKVLLNERFVLLCTSEFFSVTTIFSHVSNVNNILKSIFLCAVKIILPRQCQILLIVNGCLNISYFQSRVNRNLRSFSKIFLVETCGIWHVYYITTIQRQVNFQFLCRRLFWGSGNVLHEHTHKLCY